MARAASVALLALCAWPCACATDPGQLPAVDEGTGAGAPVGAFASSGPKSSAGSGPDPDDRDEDGFTPSEGDCDDTDPNRNPNAIEVPTEPGAEPSDEDCDGEIDEADSSSCDDDLALDSLDPIDAARAIGLCKQSAGPHDWGLVEARWVMATGVDAPDVEPFESAYARGHGLLASFGPNLAPRDGLRLLALSTGTARLPGTPGYSSVEGFVKGYEDAFPDGFPQDAPACPGTGSGYPYDTAALELTMRTPSNATGLAFELDFYTYEWPDYVCSPYNDVFLALLSPAPDDRPDGNISFDADGNIVSVNNGLLEVCGCDEDPPGPCVAGGKLFACSRGNAELSNTGFDDSAATGWLRTEAPVSGDSEITLRFVIHDSGDGMLDSTVLLDRFRWIATSGVRTGTIPLYD
jgi:hypothetical protein